MPTYDYTILAAALEGLEAQHARIVEQIRQVRELLAAAPPAPEQPAITIPAAPPKRQLSEKSRAAITDAQKRRWEKFRKQKTA